jgi:predicted DCC family thiol-disulfide oxidoreductase YuxK
MISAESTRTGAATSKAVIIYDGHCKFCVGQVNRLVGDDHRIAYRSFRDSGVLDDYPGLDFESCVKEMKLIKNGRIYGGAEAVFRTVMIRHRVWGKIFLLYYVPGIRSLMDGGYRWVARNRFRIAGRTTEDCESGVCKRHSG